MCLRRQRGQLSGALGYRGRPPARLGAPRGHLRDPASQNRHRSPLFPWSRRVLPAICNAGPLHVLTKKDAVFHWSADCQDTFDHLKMLLTTSPITAFPDFSQSFRLYTDASTAGLGAILAQVREGKERIICCASRSLNQPEKAYPSTKLECLAIVCAVAKFRPYLMAMPFEVYTDHYALQWLKTMRTGSALTTAGQQSWKSTTLQLNIGQGRPRPMLMASASCKLIRHLQKMCSSTFASLKTRKKRENSRRSSTLPLISVDKHCGSSSATAMITRPVAAFALK